MTRSIRITPRASQDLDELFEWIAQSNPDAALLFFDAARQTIAKLAQTPGMGSPYAVNNPPFGRLAKESR